MYGLLRSLWLVGGESQERPFVIGDERIQKSTLKRRRRMSHEPDVIPLFL